MVKKLLTGTLLSLVLSGTSFATSGYWGSTYSNTLKSDKGECIHSSAFNDQSEQLSECDKSLNQ
jgi:hypothetical protein